MNLSSQSTYSLLLILLFLVLINSNERVLAEKQDCRAKEWLLGFRGASIARQLRAESKCKTLIYFAADYCAPCKLLKLELFSHQSFLSQLGEFSKVEMEFPGDWRERRLADKLAVKSVPALFVVGELENGDIYRKPIQLHYSTSSGALSVLSISEAVKRIRDATGPSKLHTNAAPKRIDND